MAFDAKQAVIDKLTHLDDEIKQAEAKRDAEAAENDRAIERLVEERDAWQALLAGGADEKKPPAKKATAKK
ncbi:hypothetical protein UB45_07745 [Terrabacter sp. 28]|nr:hypothetical protein UB45_07745 [Terrabacter sp. 28]